mmetsp:Transcript_43188/g.78555  ORF Transcript_43188/g.78555 Transcript_43188/m.78555 type:complete len:298 (+) Transcript_43188:85-978(+)
MPPSSSGTSMSTPSSSSSSSSSALGESHVQQKFEDYSPFISGFLAGMSVTAALHPWDRALYLSVIRDTPFLSRVNWQNPYGGLSQTLVGRSVSSGLYFPLEQMCSQAIGSNIIGGQTASVIIGLVLNPLNLVKYQCWGQEQYTSFKATALKLYGDAGPLVFLRGAMPTMIRDGIFGVCFGCRKSFQRDGEGNEPMNFAVAVLCAALGTTLSSPFNYIRNLAFAEPSWMELESMKSKRAYWDRVWMEMLNDVRAQDTIGQAVRCLQARFRLGWGTLRVAVGMGLTDQAFRTYCKLLGA